MAYAENNTKESTQDSFHITFTVSNPSLTTEPYPKRIILIVTLLLQDESCPVSPKYKVFIISALQYLFLLTNCIPIAHQYQASKLHIHTTHYQLHFFTPQNQNGSNPTWRHGRFPVHCLPRRDGRFAMHRLSRRNGRLTVHRISRCDGRLSVHRCPRRNGRLAMHCCINAFPPWKA